MLMSTAYFPEHRQGSTYPISVDEPDADILRRRALHRPDTGSLSKLILEALGASAWQSSRQTFGYRWRGENTLDWGNLDNWIQIKLVRDMVESARIQTWLVRYDTLQQFVVDSSRLRQIEEFYCLRNATAVRRFLRAHPELTKVLLEVRAHLQRCFGPDPQVVLEVVGDPEVEGWDQLFAYILTRLPVNEAQARLDRLDEEWFPNQPEQVNNFFNFNLEFI